MSLRCPRCLVDLAPEPHGGARFDRCPRCRGLALNVAVLRQFAPGKRVRDLWLNLPVGREDGPCPSCGRPALATPVACGARTIDVDVCRPCQVLWFDADDLAAFSPQRQAPEQKTHDLSPRAAEAVVAAAVQAQELGDEAEREAMLVSAVIRGLFGGF
jgi:Zn-finger nucleic acid-binding protein